MLNVRFIYIAVDFKCYLCTVVLLHNSKIKIYSTYRFLIFFVNNIGMSQEAKHTQSCW